MSAHNHDEEIIKHINKDSETAKILRQKVEKAKNDAMVNAVLSTSIKGLSKDEALKKLEKAIDKAINKV